MFCSPFLIPPVEVIGICREHDRQGIGLAEPDPFLVRPGSTSIVKNQHLRLILQAVVQGSGCCKSKQGFVGLYLGLVGVGEAYEPRMSAGLVRRETKDHDLRRIAAEVLAFELNIPGLVGDGVHRPADIQLAAIAFHAGMRQFDVKIAESLIGAGVVLVSPPQAVLVELDVLFGGPTENHAAQTAVTDGKRLPFPILGRLLVPQHQFVPQWLFLSVLGRAKSCK